jgi:UDP-N-acetylglucosamine 2-epimerase (non-hydrolysing)
LQIRILALKSGLKSMCRNINTNNKKYKKILLVFGTRPEAIKMAPLVKWLQKDTVNFKVKVCVTAQHREMLDQVLKLFEITPEYDLNLMKSGQDLYDITSNVLLGMKDVLSDFEPNIVLVHGDTATTSAASLATFYQQIKIGHIEAGLRTGNLYSPWPEEANRQITGVLANYHFAPTDASANNLLKENKDSKSIVVTGNTVIDALFLALEKIKINKDLELKIISDIESCLNNSKFKINNSKFILVTGHRRENHGRGFINICKALKIIAVQNPTISIVYPVHLNPNVQKPVHGILSGTSNIYLIEPLQYEQFIYLMDKSYFIITDSGGVQEEAPSLGKPVLLMRDTTERPEALEAGTVKLVGTNTNTIVNKATDLINNQQVYDQMSEAYNPYGDGKACEKIVNFLRGC